MFLIKTKKSPNYQIIFSVNEKRTSYSTKTKNRRAAEKTFQSFSAPSKKNEITHITLSKFQEEYIEHLSAAKSQKYIRSVELSFSQFIEFIGDARLDKINLLEIDHFIHKTFSRTKYGASLYYRTLKAAFSKALLWNYIDDNPFKKIKFPKFAKNTPVIITFNEFEVIRSNVKEEYLRDLYNVAIYTGMRLGELVNMKRGWIDLQKNIITVKNGNTFQTKSKKERIIPFGQQLKNIFEKYSKAADKNDYIFTRVKGIKLNEDFISKKFKKAVRAADLDDRRRMHDLRHSMASMLVQKGVSLYVVKELLGHENISTTQIYSHLQQDNLEKAIALL
jgi:site-specific recombinase XerD